MDMKFTVKKLQICSCDVQKTEFYLFFIYKLFMQITEKDYNCTLKNILRYTNGTQAGGIVFTVQFWNTSNLASFPDPAPLSSPNNFPSLYSVL